MFLEMIKRSYKSRLLVGVDDDLDALLLVAEGQLRPQAVEPLRTRCGGRGDRRQQILASDVLGIEHDEVPQADRVVLVPGTGLLQCCQDLVPYRSGGEEAVDRVGVAPLTIRPRESKC